MGSLPESYANFLTSLNARDAEDLHWENIKLLLIEEYMKHKEKNENKNPTMHFLQGKDRAPEAEVTHVAAILEIHVKDHVTVNHRRTIEVTKTNQMKVNEK